MSKGIIRLQDQQILEKDSLSGHYELMGIKNNIPFKTFAETGFP